MGLSVELYTYRPASFTQIHQECDATFAFSRPDEIAWTSDYAISFLSLRQNPLGLPSSDFLPNMHGLYRRLFSCCPAAFWLLSSSRTPGVHVVETLSYVRVIIV